MYIWYSSDALAHQPTENEGRTPEIYDQPTESEGRTPENHYLKAAIPVMSIPVINK